MVPPEALAASTPKRYGPCTRMCFSVCGMWEGATQGHFHVWYGYEVHAFGRPFFLHYLGMWALMMALAARGGHAHGGMCIWCLGVWHVHLVWGSGCAPEASIDIACWVVMHHAHGGMCTWYFVSGSVACASDAWEWVCTRGVCLIVCCQLRRCAPRNGMWIMFGIILNQVWDCAIYLYVVLRGRAHQLRPLDLLAGSQRQAHVCLLDMSDLAGQTRVFHMLLLRLG